MNDGDTVEVIGSRGTSYTLERVGNTYSCTCAVWKFQRRPIHLRTCKHLRAHLGDAHEEARVPSTVGARRAPRTTTGSAATTVSTTVDAGEPKLLLAHRYKAEIDVTGWWMSEKLDGVRAYWDGERFLSRQGNVFVAPPWFIEHFPSTPLDGELFGGRGAFQRTVSIVRRQDGSDDWAELSYMVFDAPELHAPFEERIATIDELVEACGSPYLEASHHEQVHDVEHLASALARVEADGAEGLMLRQPQSPYQVGRSWTLLKVKSFYDSEARVIDHLEGTGKHMGRLGALMVESRSGVRFKIGTGFTDVQRESPPAIGSLVTFRYQELTNAGVPRFPSFVGERIDLAWEQVDDQPRRTAPIETGLSTRTLPVPAMGAPVTVVSTPRPVPRAQEPEPEVDAEGNAYLEFLKGKTVRFWEIEWEGTAAYIEYGRVDREPRTETKTFASPLETRRFVDKQIKGKLEKGYVDDI